ncbi:MAG: WXG100 family type VII secretion target [Bifidobacteriaceae bacterium]|nr:WXG100 family type VII secretion target [Bifidobacteriaceae bacterium]
MALFGMDIQQVRDMSGSMDREAGEIQAVLADVRRQMAQIQWMGPDADRFREQWQGQQPRLSQIVESLRNTARQAREHAQRQDDVSRH